MSWSWPTAHSDDQSRIFFGAWVKLENDACKVAKYRIVGPDEFDLEKGLISIDSPLARALLKRTVDEEVTVVLPGQMVYTILEIRYASAGRA